MEISMIGHASIFVKTKDCRILMDPVLWDPHQEGLFDVCPKREVIRDRIPEFDVLIISHRHLDHFDIRSLASLPKTVDVFIPRDNLIKSCLSKLGYSQIYTLSDFNEVKLSSTSLFTTRSENRVPEYGIIFADPSGVCWNQVDTIVSPSTINLILSRYSQMDLLLATWQPMLEVNYQLNQSISFPYLPYNSLLRNVSLIQPKAVVPASNGFKAVNGSSWLNQILFPVTREQFCRDVKRIYPEVADKVYSLDPGDMLTFEDNQFSYLAGGCNFVKKITDDTDDLEFSPVNIGCNLIDSNRNNYDVEEMLQVINEEISLSMPKFIEENRALMFEEHCRWQVIYQLQVVFPEFTKIWHFDFSEAKIEAKEGRNPFANLLAYVTASSLYGILKGFNGSDYPFLGGYYRSYSKIYSVVKNLGLIFPENIEITEPLIMKIPDNSLDKVLDKEIEKWGSDETVNNTRHQVTKMMRFGNTLIRMKQKN